MAAISSRSPSGSHVDAASAHPALGCVEGLMVTTPGAASISTSSVSPATSNSGLASRIPLELPILTSLPRTTAISRKRAHIVFTPESTGHGPAPATLPPSERQGARGGSAERAWWPLHSRGWFSAFQRLRTLDSRRRRRWRSPAGRSYPPDCCSPAVWPSIQHRGRLS